MQSVVSAYLVTVAMLIPALGWLADRFGTKRIFLIAIILFTLGSLACGLSPNLKFLVFSRSLQGIGGALLVPVGRLIVFRSYPRERLMKVLSFITLPALIGPMLGPVLGGFLTEYVSWHAIFLINLPVGLVGFIFAWQYMPSIRPDSCPKFDLWGFALFSGVMVLVSLALNGVQAEMANKTIAVLSLTDLACFTAYCVKSHFSLAPIFSLHIFKIRLFTIGIAGNLMTRLGTGAMLF